MLEKIKDLINSKTVKNGSWLYLLQIFNTIIPLITLPYVTRVLGSHQYGVFAFSLNIISYFQVVVEYGFNLTGVQKIASSDSEDEIKNIYNSIMSSKLILSMISIFGLLIMCFIYRENINQMLIIMILFSMVIGSAIQQIWLFQGLQQMKYITIVNVSTRTISVLLIFLLVNSPKDIYLYSILFGMTTLGNGVFNYLVVTYILKIKFSFTSLERIKLELQDGWYIFTTDVMSKVFSSFGVTILGVVSSSNEVGVFAAIQKIPLMLAMMFAPLSQAIFPIVSKKYNHNFSDGYYLVRKIRRIILPIVAVGSIIIAVFSEEIINLIYGPEYSKLHFILVPLISWMFFSILNNFLGIQTLVASGHQREYSIAFKVGVISLILSNLILGNLFGVLGISLAAFIGELLLTISLCHQIKKLKAIKLKV